VATRSDDSAPRYYAVSDESQITATRYRSIAAVSLPLERAEKCNAAFAEVLRAHSVAEFKWHELNGAKRRFCAMALIDAALDYLLACEGRIDVVVWDTHDSRHCIPGRDDDRNFERMYFHLHKRLMLRRPPGARWDLRPDEKLGIDWGTLQDCLSAVGAWRKYYERTLLSDEFSIKQFDVKSLRQVRSCDLPLCQVADLFAGMAAFCRTHHDLVRGWLRQQSGQQSLFAAAPQRRLTNREKERMPVISHFDKRAKARRLGVSLHTHGYFSTPNPANPVNFWHYVPQHSRDRAPTRDS
jgi:hypothetical protein